jgi:hypothetical protein
VATFPSRFPSLPNKDLQKTPVQKLAYKLLIHTKQKGCISDTIETRLTSLFMPYELNFNDLISLRTCFQVLKRCQVAVVAKVLKTWCNGWATSYRYQESIKLPCLFGCTNSRDHMSHYLQCTHLLWLWKFMIPEVNDDPLQRWALIHPTEDHMRQISCMHAVYHAVRRHLKSDVSSLPVNGLTQISGTKLRANWTVFADFFSTEARGLGVSTFKFSLTGFLSYLVTGQRMQLRIGDTSSSPPCSNSQDSSMLPSSDYLPGPLNIGSAQSQPTLISQAT